MTFDAQESERLWRALADNARDVGQCKTLAQSAADAALATHEALRKEREERKSSDRELAEATAAAIVAQVGASLDRRATATSGLTTLALNGLLLFGYILLTMQH